LPIELILKIATVAFGFVTAFIAATAAMQKRDAHKIELTEKLYKAVESNSKLLVIDIFSKLYGRRYRYPDVQRLLEDDDVMQRMLMLKKRSDAVIYENGEYRFTKLHKSMFGRFNVLLQKMTVGVFLVLLILSLVGTFTVAFISIKVAIVGVLLIGLCTLVLAYSGNELYWYKEASRILDEERQKAEARKESSMQSEIEN